jgi:hypothetical protein
MGSFHQVCEERGLEADDEGDAKGSSRVYTEPLRRAQGIGSENT